MESTHRLVTARRVLGETVFSASGGKIGKIEDLMIDKSSGRTLYALMAFDGFLGIGTQYYPVPWSMLDYNTAVNAYVVPLTPAQVENAHSVSDAEVEHEIEWREKIHEFYGATPYWPGALV
jgi:sporulation protein YlmC with PRC-barrel domain